MDGGTGTLQGLPVAAALATGLVGGLGHCVGMCGPLVGSFALAAGPRGARAALLGQLAYHAGRVTTYAALGAVLGLTGQFVNVAGRLAGLQEAVAVAAGLLMVAMGLGAAGLAARVKRLEAAAAGRVARFAHALLEGGGAGRLYPTGLALGLLPCGLSWSVLLGAAATGSAASGLAVALAFGVGTLPALLAVGALAAVLSARARGALYRAGGFLVAALGVVFVLRGLGLVHAL